MKPIEELRATRFSNTQALMEGWDLFDVEGRTVLQKIDDPASVEGLGYDDPKFVSDAAAIIFVAMCAQHGSTYHLDALERIGTLSEYTL